MHEYCNVSLRGTECIQNANVHIFYSVFNALYVQIKRYKHFKKTLLHCTFTLWHGMSPKYKFSHLRFKWFSHLGMHLCVECLKIAKSNDLKIAAFHIVTRNAYKTQFFTSPGRMLENSKVSLHGTECSQNANFHIFRLSDWKLQSFTFRVWAQWNKVFLKCF